MLASFAILAFCVAFGALAGYFNHRPDVAARVSSAISSVGKGDFFAHQSKQFSPRRTLFVIGAAPNHPACRLQRRLIKPALAAFIRDDISVVEVYGTAPALKNGASIAWLDPALLRHAMDAEDGFHLIFVDDAGKTAFRSLAPVVTHELLVKTGLRPEPQGPRTFSRRTSDVLRRLRAA